MSIYLETQRLTLKEITDADLNNLLDLDSDPEVMKYLTDGKPSSEEEIKIIINKVQLMYEKFDRKLGFWNAFEKQTSEFIGWFHFRPAKDDPNNTQRIELGYRLKKKFWRQGFATEGSLALIKKGFEELGVNEVFALTMKENKGSRGVMDKVGLKFVREFHNRHFPGTTELDVEYSLHKSQWSGS